MLVLPCFAAKYQDGRLWQVDMKIPRRNVGVTGVDGSAPIRDRTSLWPGGVIPYTIAYSIRKYYVCFVQQGLASGITGPLPDEHCSFNSYQSSIMVTGRFIICTK